MEYDLKHSEALKIMIDHHQQPKDYASVTYSDVTMSSTCEMVWDFVELLEDLESMNTTIGDCLYTGILTCIRQYKEFVKI